MKNVTTTYVGYFIFNIHKENVMEEKNKQAADYMSDEEIVELYWKREERAIHETDRKYRNYLYRVAFNILHDRLDSEECLNDTYLGTWNSIPPAKPTAFQIFLSKIMRNTAVNRYRYNMADKRIASQMTVALEELDESMMYQLSDEEEKLVSEIGQLLNEYLEGLSKRGRFVFVSRYYYADEIVEIARMLGVSERTVYRELVELRNGLRERLEKEGFVRE